MALFSLQHTKRLMISEMLDRYGGVTTASRLAMSVDQRRRRPANQGYNAVACFGVRDRVPGDQLAGEYQIGDVYARSWIEVGTSGASFTP